MDKDIAITMASQIFNDYRRMRNWGTDFDHWISLSDDWDLNIWSDNDGVLHATLYSVANGNTITTTAYSIP